ncbi:hypothetical protein ACFVVA_37040 [Kitasatospora sp. NPDC058048]|uniref:hypothetical protein n=1 Tax=Kitasatospora sp. NPDC058048 TaxID=3346313 RepID=UPI0036DF7186
MTTADQSTPPQCPRCNGPLALFDGDTGGRSRATPGRSVEVCGLCCQSEAILAAAGVELVPPAEWPVPANTLVVWPTGAGSAG